MVTEDGGGEAHSLRLWSTFWGPLERVRLRFQSENPSKDNSHYSIEHTRATCGVGMRPHCMLCKQGLTHARCMVTLDLLHAATS